MDYSHRFFYALAEDLNNKNDNNMEIEIEK